jgi:hypothetical protein
MFAGHDPHTTGNALIDAQADFLRARRAHAAARVGRWLAGKRRCRYPRLLGDSAPMVSGGRRLAVVPLDSIVGTVERTAHFDAAFRPASEVVRYRWERIALAHRSGIALPPIEVWAGPDGYYVADGRHRVSVGHALGHRDINAWVVGMPSRRRSQIPELPRRRVALDGWEAPAAA